MIDRTPVNLKPRNAITKPCAPTDKPFKNPECHVDRISLAEQYRTTPWFPAGLKLELEALLVGISLAEQYRPVDIATPAMLKARNRDHIFSEAIPLGEINKCAD